MDIKNINCPGCGAPIFEAEGKFVCQYCGREVLVESRKLTEIGNTIERVETKTQEVIVSGTEATQLELRKLQLTQELSMLQMQLSNIRSEKRNLNLAPKKTRKHRDQIRQIELEETELVNRINQIQSVLYPPQAITGQGKQNTDRFPSRKPLLQTKVDEPKNSGFTFAFAWLLGIFGGHRFYTGHLLLGFVYLFTAGLFTLGYFFDLLMICYGKYKDSKGRLLSPMSPTGRKVAKFFTGLMIWVVIARLGTSEETSAVPPVWIVISLILTFILVNLDWIWPKLVDRKGNATAE